MILNGFYWFLLACEAVAVVFLVYALIHKLKGLKEHF